MPYSHLIEPWMTTVDNEVYLKFGDEYYSYNLRTDQKEMVFSTKNPVAKNYLKCQKVNSTYGDINYWGPFFARPGQVWFGGNCSAKLLTFPDINNSPLIILPERRFTPPLLVRIPLPHPDGKSAIAVDERNIYKITPKEK